MNPLHDSLEIVISHRQPRASLMHDINVSEGDSIYTTSYLSPPPTRGNWWHTVKEGKKKQESENALANESCFHTFITWIGFQLETRVILDFIVTIPARFTTAIGWLDRAIKVHVIGRKLPLRYYARVHYFRLALVHLDERQIVFVQWGIFVLSMQIRGEKNL